MTGPNVPLGPGFGGSGTGTQIRFADLLPGNLGELLDGVFEGAGAAANLTPERIDALLASWEATGGAVLFSRVLGGMDVAFTTTVQDIQGLVAALTGMALDDILELPGKAVDALVAAERLLTDPSEAAAARRLGRDLGASFGDEISTAATSMEHLFQQLGRILGVVLVEVWLSLITGGLWRVAAGPKWTRKLVGTVEGVWKRLDPRLGRKHDRLTHDTGTGPTSTGGSRANHVDADASPPDSTARGTKDRGTHDRGTDGEPQDVAANDESPVVSKLDPDEQEIDDALGAWETGFRHLAKHEPQKPNPEVRELDANRSRMDPGLMRDDRDALVEDGRFKDDASAKRDLTPRVRGLARAQSHFNDRLHSDFGANARHPRKRKNDGTLGYYYEQWLEAGKQLERLKAKMLDAIKPVEKLDPTDPYDRRRLEKALDIIEEAKDPATRRYNAFRGRFWTHLWDDRETRQLLLEPAFTDPDLAFDVSHKSLDQIWEDDALRRRILERHWGLRWNRRGQAPKSPIVKVLHGEEGGLRSWEAMNLDHFVRKSDNPFMAIDNRNLNVTTAVENQDLLEPRRAFDREVRNGGVEYRGVAASSPEDRRIEQFVVVNKDALQQVRKERQGATPNGPDVDVPTSGGEDAVKLAPQVATPLQ